MTALLDLLVGAGLVVCAWLLVLGVGVAVLSLLSLGDRRDL